MDKDNQEIKPRIDYKFYSNITNINVTGVDAYIDFMQYPPENGEVPAIRIYLSKDHLKVLREVFLHLPEFNEVKTKRYNSPDFEDMEHKNSKYRRVWRSEKITDD